MKKILFALFILFTSLQASAQITVYEYQDDKAYCTFELDSPLALKSSWIKGTYRAYKYYDIPYFEMTFLAKNFVSKKGQVILEVTPDFYNFTYLAKVIGQKDNVKGKDYHFTFVLEGDSIIDKTAEETKEIIQMKTTFNQKEKMNFTKIPTTFIKTNKGVDWKRFPKDLKKNLQDKDRTLGRRY